MEYNYIDERIREQICYYSKVSKRCQRCYRTLSVLNLLFSALIPIVSLSANEFVYASYIVAGLGAAITIVSSLNYFLKYKDRWIETRMTLEKLNSELSKYRSSTCQYFQLDSEAKMNLLVNNCESILNDERTLNLQCEMHLQKLQQYPSIPEQCIDQNGYHQPQPQFRRT